MRGKEHHKKFKHHTWCVDLTEIDIFKNLHEINFGLFHFASNGTHSRVFMMTFPLAVSRDTSRVCLSRPLAFAL